MVANRSVGTGLTASAVFSSWMWINETAFSAVNCYKYGVSAPMVYLNYASRFIYVLMPGDSGTVPASVSK